MAEKGTPDIPQSSHILQLLLDNPKAFPRQTGWDSETEPTHSSTFSLGDQLPSQLKGCNPPFLLLDCPEILTLIPTLLTPKFKLGLETANHGNFSASSGWVIDHNHNRILLPQCTLVAWKWSLFTWSFVCCTPCLNFYWLLEVWQFGAVLVINVQRHLLAKQSTTLMLISSRAKDTPLVFDQLGTWFLLLAVGHQLEAITLEKWDP